MRYPAVQKIRKSLARGLFGNQHKRSTAIDSTRGGNNGGAHGLVSNVGNGILNKFDDLLNIRDKFNRSSEDDGNTGCSIVEGWECSRLGRYAHPVDCQRYIRCTFRGENTVYECDDDEAYDPDQRECTTDWSSCEALEQCLYHRQLLEDPSDANGYFICISNRRAFHESYTVYRRQCSEGRIFDDDYQQCMEDDDAKRIRDEKKRRQTAKKLKKCSKRKGNGKKKHQKKNNTSNKKQ